MKSIVAKRERERRIEERRKEKKQLRIVSVFFFGILAIYFAYDLFFGYLQFGGNLTYHLLVHVLPLILGVLSVACWVRSDLKEIFNAQQKLQNSLASLFLLLILGLGAGLVLFLLPAQIIWDRINLAASRRQPATEVTATVTEFAFRKSPGIWVRAYGRLAKLPACRDVVADYKNEDPAHYSAALSTRKGLLGTWIIDDWQLYSR
jgi:hypothetical protein